MFTRVQSYAAVGIEGRPVEVEVDVSPGLPAFDIVGLPDSAVREARERVRSAIRNSGCEFPNRRITVNLAPADLRKIGAGFDLAMALGILVATGQLTAARLYDLGVVGELALDGHLRSVPGMLAMAMAARQGGMRALVVPRAAVTEAGLSGLPVLAPTHLSELVEQLRTGRGSPEVVTTRAEYHLPMFQGPDLAMVQGQPEARRALEIAAAGGHHLYMTGPPGVGKTLLAQCLPGILPPLTEEEALQVTAIHSAAGFWPGGLMLQRPFRDPHHSATRAALLGGGQPLRPGELTLAHHGVLFLDELPEFRRDVLEALRQPLESGLVHVARANVHMLLPARVQLVAAANPCPCGFSGDEATPCSCRSGMVAQYQERVSGPLLDRLDLQVRLSRVVARGDTASESSAAVAARVLAARRMQIERDSGRSVWNAELVPGPTHDTAALGLAARTLLEQAVRTLGLSGRGRDRVLRVARTIADLSGSDAVTVEHLGEALHYRISDSAPKRDLLPARTNLAGQSSDSRFSRTGTHKRTPVSTETIGLPMAGGLLDPAEPVPRPRTKPRRPRIHRPGESLPLRHTTDESQGRR